MFTKYEAYKGVSLYAEPRKEIKHETDCKQFMNIFHKTV